MPPGHTCGGRSDRAATLLPVRRRPDSADAMLVLANVLWSLNYATTKYAFGEWLPLAFSATRFLCAGIIFALFVLWREGSLRIRRSDVKLVVATAAVGILLNQLTFNYAVDKTTAGNTALILASAPAFAALFASLAGHEHVQRKHWLALVVSVAGVVLVIQGGSGVAGVSLVGDLLAVGAAITWAAYSVMLRPLFGRYSAARISALMVSIGGVMILPFGLPQMHAQDWAGLSGLHWAAWGYSTIFPVLVTNLLYFRALRTIGASRATLYMYLQPFLGALFAAWLLGEQVTGLQILGGAVIVGGVSMGRLMPGATARERGAGAPPAPCTWAGCCRAPRCAGGGPGCRPASVPGRVPGPVRRRRAGRADPRAARRIPRDHRSGGAGGAGLPGAVRAAAGRVGHNRRADRPTPGRPRRLPRVRGGPAAGRGGADDRSVPGVARAAGNGQRVHDAAAAGGAGRRGAGRRARPRGRHVRRS